MPTIRDVAKMAGTSVSAVSAVLNGGGLTNIRVGKDTGERIRAAAAHLGYTPNQLARSLVTGRTGVLGLVFPYSDAFIDNNPFSTQVMSGVFAEAVREKYNLMLHTATGDDWNTADTSALIDPRVDGLLLVIPGPDSPVVAQCERERFPCVALVYQPVTDDAVVVNADERAGGRLATEHLLGLGHTRIAHMMGWTDVATAEPRRDGYVAALREAGIEPDPALIVPANFDRSGGYAAMQALLALPKKQRPTAVFAANDLCAEGALRAMEENGLSAPGDMALVGYDDSWLCDMTRPKLTSVRMPVYEMSVLATQMLISLVEGKEVSERQPVLPVSLTVRESCGASAPV